MPARKNGVGTASASLAHRILEDRTRQLAGRGQGRVGAAAAFHAVLLCAVGEEICGLPLEAVARVLPDSPCGALPGAAPPWLGLIAADGRAYGLVDLALVLGHARPAQAGGHVLLLRQAPPRLALRVTRVLGVERVRPLPQGEAGVAPINPAGVIEGYAHAPPAQSGGPPRLVGLVDPVRLLQPVLASVQLPGA